MYKILGLKEIERVNKPSAITQSICYCFKDPKLGIADNANESKDCFCTWELSQVGKTKEKSYWLLVSPVSLVSNTTLGKSRHLVKSTSH